MRTTTTTQPTNAAIWASLGRHFHRVFGDSSPFFLGALLAYPLHASLRHKTGTVPGIWVSGPKGTGKTVACESAQLLWSGNLRLNCSAGITSSGLARTLASEAYPVWIDEFRTGTAPPDLYQYASVGCEGGEILKGTLRGGGAKPLAIPHPPMISGEDQPEDIVCASRFLHFTPSPMPGRNRHDDFADLLADRMHFKALGRHLRENQEWLADVLTKILEKDLFESLRATPTLEELTNRQIWNLTIATGAYMATETKFMDTKPDGYFEPLGQLLALTGRSLCLP